MKQAACTCLVFVFVLVNTGCSQLAEILGSGGTIRKSGQVEIYYIQDSVGASSEVSDSQGQAGGDTKSYKILGSLSDWEQGLERTSLLGDFGDPIRYSDDVVTITVLSGYLHNLPKTFTGSRDIVLFAEVWENAAAGYNSRSLNSIVYMTRNQQSGRMNFDGNLAYGPTNFKGHPLRIKFTLMVLQSERGKELNNSVQVLETLASSTGAASPLGPLSSQAVATVRQVLRSQPDVEAFDFEFTMMSDRPESLEATILDGQGSKKSSGLGGASHGSSKNIGGVSNSGDMADTVRNNFLNNGIDLVKLLDAVVSISKMETGNIDNRPIISSDMKLVVKLYEVLEEFDAKYLLDSYGDEDIAIYQPLSGNIHTYRDAARIVTSRLIARPYRVGQFREGLERYRSILVKKESGSGGIPESEFNSAIDSAESLDDLVEKLLGFDEVINALVSPFDTEGSWVGYQSPYDIYSSLLKNQVPVMEYVKNDANWLRFGRYAVVETRPTRTRYGVRPLAEQEGWPSKFRVEGDKIKYSGDEDVDIRPLIRSERNDVATNYLLISIAPGQIRQDSSVIRDGSRMAIDLLESMTQAASDPEKTIKLAKELSEDIPRSIHISSLENTARSLVRQLTNSGVGINTASGEQPPFSMKSMSEVFQSQFTSFSVLYIENAYGDDSDSRLLKDRLYDEAKEVCYRWQMRMLQIDQEQRSKVNEH